MKNRPIIPIILSGGSGSRLWPLSRESFPKQYLSINSENKNSLLQKTQKRVSKLKNIKNPILICNENHRFIIAEQMREINVNPQSILLEPFGKNTAPAITIAALKALEKEDNPSLLVLSSDHYIDNEEEFIKVIEEGLENIDGKIITFGVVPSSPETGYGYIKSEAPYDLNNFEGSKILKFIEKPKFEKAKLLIKDKCYTWNSGIFMFSAKTLLKEIEKFCPEILYFAKKSLDKSKSDLDFQRLDEDSFNNFPNISIDNAVMEKTKLGFVIPLNAGWSDIGSWNSVWETSNKDKDGNHIVGKAIIKETKNCYIRSEDRLVVGIGLSNLVIVETNDAVLIVDRENAQDVKNIVRSLKLNGIKEGLNHREIFRPWGSYLSIAEDEKWQVKLITVKPGEKLSLQMHHHRSEHWIVVKGIAKVEIENQVFSLTENKSTYIPIEAKHRLSNPGKVPLKLIEVQSGTYLGEDDIIRFEDKYGRSIK